MTAKEKAKELVDKYFNLTDHMQFDEAKECAMVVVDRNIVMFTKLVNRMDDFSNESRQVIWQLIENEEKVEQEIDKL